MNKAQATDLVSILQGAYPRVPFADSTVGVYVMVLADLEFEAAKRAVLELIQTSKWLPTIAEIRERVVESRADLPPPELAWGEVMAAIRQVGMYASPVFECDEIGRAVSAIGWRSICTDENVSSTRARFIDAYRAVREQRIDEERTGRYVPPDRQLPQRGAESVEFLPEGAQVYVTSSFGRRHAPAERSLGDGSPDTNDHDPDRRNPL